MTHRQKIKADIFLFALVVFLVVFGMGTVYAQDGIIGMNTIGSLESSADPDGRAWGSIGPAESVVYTAVAGDKVDTINIYADWGIDGDAATVNVGIYTVHATDSIPVTLVSATTIVVNSNNQQWWPVEVDIDLVAGTKYCVAFSITASHSLDVWRDGQPADKANTPTDGTGNPLPSTFGVNFTTGLLWSFYANVKNTPAGGGGNRVGILE